jgi:dTDP-4-dehydrorhamnose 3,5-epimerase
LKIKNTKIKGVYIIKPTKFKDNRGVFFESFNDQIFKKKIDSKVNFVQDNQSISKKGVLRGLHFQNPPFGQAKLVSVLKGRVLDVVVDLRKESRTFGEYIMEELSEYNNRQLFIPKGMAHGFLTIEDNTIFSYKCSDFYHKESEDSIVWNDSTLNIKWPNSNPILSEKDENAKKFTSFVSTF